MITTYYAHKTTFELTSVERDSSNASIIIQSFTLLKQEEENHAMDFLFFKMPP